MSTTRIVIFVVTVAAIVIVILVTGWANDEAPPGSGGRVTVPEQAPDDSP